MPMDMTQFFNSSTRMKRSRWLLEELLCEDDEDDDDSPTPFRDEHGVYRRKGGWKPTPNLHPEASGMTKWRHTPEDSFMSKLLARPGTYQEGSYWANKCRRVLGVPRVVFDELLAAAGQAQELKDIIRGDGVKAPPTQPLQMKLAGFMARCRQGLTYESASNLVGVDVETLRRFAKRFVRWHAVHEYDKYVHMPKEGEELQKVLNLHAKLGFPGAVACYDGVHFAVDKVPAALFHEHKGKEGFTTRAFNVAGTMIGKIVHIYGSVPGTVNDKEMAHYDPTMQQLKDGTFVSNAVFHLYNSNRKLVPYSGLWSVVDNGYHAWRSCQYPSKYPANPAESAWSTRIESVRKPGSECIFGKMKARWLVLEHKWMFHNSNLKNFDKAVQHFEDTFKFLAAMHNRLLDHDGIGDLGELDSDWLDAPRPVELARAANKPLHPHMPGTLAGLLDQADDGEIEEGHDDFLQKLITHFEVASSKGEVYWLKTAKESRALHLDNRTREGGHRKRALENDEADHEEDEDDDEAGIRNGFASESDDEA